MARDPKTKPTRPSRSERRAARKERFAQLRTAFTMTRERDKRLVPYMVIAVLLPLIVAGVVTALTGLYLIVPVLGVAVAAIAGLQIFSRRAQASAYKEAEGKAGVAAGIVENMRGDWKLTPAVQYNRQQDFVHRVVGRPGVILVAEGSVAKRQLLRTEATRVKKIAGSTPVYEVIVGNGEGEIPIKDLSKHLIKLPRNLKPAEATAVNKRLNALGGTNVPLPKGPIPTRVPRGKN